MAATKEQATSVTRSTWVLRGVSLAVLIVVVGIAVYLVASTRRSFVNVTLGCEAVDGVEESGFHDQEHEGTEPHRWTNGRGTLVVPIRRDKPRSLALHIRVHQPKGTTFRLVANRQELFSGPLPSGDFEKVLSLKDISSTDPLSLELSSDVWKPKGTIPGSTDERNLGVDVRSIRLLREEAPEAATRAGS
jgi:hypothetical protein